MAENTKIQWTDYTMNPWRGCTKVSPGCAHCYAETQSKRNPKVLGIWGDQGTRPVAAESYWRQPLRWDREAEQAGERRRVFCASLADVFEDRPELVAPRLRLFKLIGETPNLDWLLLTKRPQNIGKLWPRYIIHDSQAGPRQERWTSDLELGIAQPNIWLGVSVEDQQRADERIPQLLRIPAAVRFLSCEPLLGPLDLAGLPDPLCRTCFGSGISDNHVTGRTECSCIGDNLLDGIDWVIVGGESGSQARPCHIEWVRALVKQCQNAGVACFVKQLGRKITWEQAEGRTLRMIDSKGGDPEEWPADLRVRQFPR